MSAKQVDGMAKGQFGDSIQALPADDSVHAKVTVGAASVESDMTGAQVVRLATDVAVYIKFGIAGVTAAATDIYFPAGVEFFVMPKSATHVAIIQATGAGIATLTKAGE